MIKKFIKFMIIGASGTIVNLLIFSFLIYFNFKSIPAATIAFVFAASNNFYWNFKWTFKNDAMDKSLKAKYTQFLIISIVNFGVNIVFLKIFNRLLNFEFLLAQNLAMETIGKIEVIFSQALAIGIASVLNFLGNYLITFREKKKIRTK